MALFLSIALTLVAVWSSPSISESQERSGFLRVMGSLFAPAPANERPDPIHSINPSEFPVNLDGAVCMNRKSGASMMLSVRKRTPLPRWIAT